MSKIIMTALARNMTNCKDFHSVGSVERMERIEFYTCNLSFARAWSLYSKRQEIVSRERERLEPNERSKEKSWFHKM